MSNDNKRMVVIGSNSFTGATFIRFLLDNDYEVVGISRSAELSEVFLPYKWDCGGLPSAKYQFSQFDLNHHSVEIADTIQQFKPACVVNFSAQSMVAESWAYPSQWYQTNVVANVELHERLRKFDFIQKYVHVTTPEVYGSCQGYVKESQIFNPSTPYAASRAACDMHLMTYFNNYNFPVVFTRAANVYGPGQQLYRIIPRTIYYIMTGKRLQLHGGGTSVRSFIHANDVASGTLGVALKGEAGSTYHLSTDSTVSIRELVEIICEKMGVSFEKSVDVAEERQGKDAAYLLDSTKAKEQLGWQDKVTLSDGVDQTIKWVAENLEKLKLEPDGYIHKA